MSRLEGTPLPNPELQKAQAFFNPTRFGFIDMAYKGETGWEIDFTNKTNKLGLVTFTSLNSDHTKVPGIAELLTYMQEKTFGIKNALDILPSHALGKTHSHVVYKSNEFTKDGVLGFSVIFGGIQVNGELLSKAIGIMPEYQGLDLAWYLRLLQANTALKNGFHSIEWDFRADDEAKAKLFIGKLGGEGAIFTPKKPGMLDSGKGEPSDKITIKWDLTSPDVQERIEEVYSYLANGEKYPGVSFDNFLDVPIVTVNNLNLFDKTKPSTLLCEIPTGDKLTIPEGMEESIGEKELRIVLSSLLDTKEAIYPENAVTNPAAIKEVMNPGGYTIHDVIRHNAQSFYVFKRKSS